MKTATVIKVFKTGETWKNPAGKEMEKALVRMDNDEEGWTFSSKFVEGKRATYDTIESKFAYKDKWYHQKFVWVDPEEAQSTPQKVGSFLPQAKNSRSPEDQKQIVRQHSQEMALRFYEIQVQTGEAKTVTIDDVRTMTDVFERDITGTTPVNPPEEKINVDFTEEIDLDEIPF